MPKDLTKVSRDEILNAKTYSHFKETLLRYGCTLCELCKGRTQLVVDRGNPSARVMMIGEAPGRNEDLQGKAFVGRSGRLLDGLLKEMGFDTNQDSLIANVAKCRPPANRAPKPEEAHTCLPYLQKQIQLVKPKVILLLGATALKHLFPQKQKAGMAGQVGQFFPDSQYPGIQFMILFHPAYILRDPGKKPLMVAHLKKFIDYWNAQS